MTQTSSTSVTELVNTEAIDGLVIAYAFDTVNAVPFFRYKSLVGAASPVGSFPRWVKDTDSLSLATEATAMTAIELETTQVSVTAARVGIARNPTNTMLEDTVLGRAQFMQQIAMDAAILLGENMDEVGTALYASAAADVTDSGNPIDLLDLVEGIGKQRTQKAKGSQVIHVHDLTLKQIQRAQIAAIATTWAAYYSPNTGGDPQYGGTFMNAPIFASSLNTTANAAADRVGCIFSRGDIEAQKMFCAFGLVVARSPTTKSIEQILEDDLLTATTQRYGCNIIATDFATKLVFDNG